MPRPKNTKPTDKELAILAVMWERGPSTVQSVHDEMHPQGQTGYTTTLKLMQIMRDKGLLVRTEGSRRHVYRPAQSQTQTQKKVVREVMGKVFAGSTEKLVMSALSVKKVSAAELEKIRAMLDDLDTV
ncbi:MAG: BlaI/MecI/CopY family transcriptional regulator [Planctomycetes bacterium]|nr:BlaI/MecI/CopY family transcriptional regulator [Planctomycetota bacterium]